MHCSCGMKVASIQEWKIHYSIGKPSVPILSRLTKTTIKQVEEAKSRLKKYKQEHILER